jgi:hypothetical protein
VDYIVEERGQGHYVVGARRNLIVEQERCTVGQGLYAVVVAVVEHRNLIVGLERYIVAVLARARYIVVAVVEEHHTETEVVVVV